MTDLTSPAHERFQPSPRELESSNYLTDLNGLNVLNA
jgi:hypothetical protein